MRFRATCAIVCPTLAAFSVPAGAESTITSAQWTAFAGASAVNTCFPNFIFTFGPVDINVDPPIPTAIPHTEFEKLRFGEGMARPMATEIARPVHPADPFAKFGILTAERSGDLVGFVVVARWTARGFIETNPAAEALASVAASEGAALRAHFAPALTFLRHAYPMTQCGMTRYQLVDAQNQDQTIDLVLRDGRLVAAREEHEPPDN